MLDSAQPAPRDDAPPGSPSVYEGDVTSARELCLPAPPRSPSFLTFLCWCGLGDTYCTLYPPAPSSGLPPNTVLPMLFKLSQRRPLEGLWLAPVSLYVHVTGISPLSGTTRCPWLSVTFPGHSGRALACSVGDRHSRPRSGFQVWLLPLDCHCLQAVSADSTQVCTAVRAHACNHALG